MAEKYKEHFAFAEEKLWELSVLATLAEKVEVLEREEDYIKNGELLKRKRDFSELSFEDINLGNCRA